jgi:hypothetical protein
LENHVRRFEADPGSPWRMKSPPRCIRPSTPPRSGQPACLP